MNHLLGLLLVLFVSSSYSQDILFKNGRLILGEGSVIENGSLLISDGIISAIGATPLNHDSQTQVIDLNGKTVVPAFIDAHAHLGYQSPFSWGAANYDKENLISNLEQYAYYGFSAVLSAGSDPHGLAKSIQEDQAQDRVQGARFLFAAGVGPRGQGPNNRFLTEVFEVEDALNQRILTGVSTPLDAISAARAIADDEISFIKVWIDDRGGSQEKLSKDVYMPLMAEGQRLRLKTFVHQQSAADMIHQIESGAAGFLHGRLERNFTSEIAQLASRNRVFIVPNLGLAVLRQQAIGLDPFLRPVLSEELIEELSQRENANQSNTELEKALKSAFNILVNDNVDIVLGTDAGAVPNHPFGYTGHKELEIYVRLGLSPMQAIVAATSKGAEHLGLRNLGQLKKGFSADLVILTSNPLENISNTQLIEAVYLKGKLVDRNKIAEQLSAQ